MILHALRSDNGLLVKLRSPSADTDILVVAVTLLSEFEERLYVDSGVGNQRQLLWLGGIHIPEQHVKALTGFHAFTGNDYVASLPNNSCRDSDGNIWIEETFPSSVEAVLFDEAYDNVGNSTRMWRVTMKLN